MLNLEYTVESLHSACVVQRQYRKMVSAIAT